ncbi:glycosyl transferase family 2 [Paenibacillus taihuensis]|uniref:Glycosyl transferase family 2 n=1 Tax=Paenibacillus taihuensis TaxID=1156355 RepID=A0A3D9SKB3_9BACL|nr:glycosyltransferase family 2 protein [Paenibacillus taihuensis]REE91370.1 glycosyl transferase family 2 [Paenibacillus taihuensis]
MLLGIHVLACNEEDVLDRCLRSVEGLADELVVTDTGSTDRTLELAKSYGARVVQHAWTDDFAAARNAGLDAARTVWVLVLDADEHIAAGATRLKLRELLRQADGDAFRVAIQSRYGSGESESLRHEAVRLFRADCGFRYTGVIHEQLVRRSVSGTIAGVDGRQCGLALLHDGYLPEAIARKGKAQRNLRLIEKTLRLTPDDPFHLYNKGVTLCQLNKPKDACAAFALAYLFAPSEVPYRPTLVRDYAKALLARDRADEAAALLHREVDRYGDYPDVQLLYGDSLMRQHRVMEARSAYEAALEAGAAGSAAARYVVEAGAGSYRARCGLAAAEAALGRADSAQRLFEAAAGEAPRYVDALAGWAEQLQAAGKSDEAIRAAMASCVGLEAPELLALQARVLGGIGAYAAALPLWREAGPLTPEEARAYAACLIGAGLVREARAVLMAAWAAGWSAAEELAAELSMDAALCSWSLGELVEVREPSCPWSPALLAVDRLLAGVEGATAELLIEPMADPSAAVQQLLGRALELGLLPLAGRLKELDASLGERYAYALYKNGYTHAAAGLLLQAMEQRQLAPEELCCLGELLYGKRLYGEALALFERAIAGAADLSAELAVTARLGAAACSLSLAMEALLPWAGAQHTLGGGWPNADLEHVQSALIRVHAAGWRTPFTGAQRRRANVLEAQEES